MNELNDVIKKIEELETAILQSDKKCKICGCAISMDSMPPLCSVCIQDVTVECCFNGDTLHMTFKLDKLL